jgi:magnesium-dependent phosphatase 1
MEVASKLIPGRLPRLVVFDLDACVWEPEMYELDATPTKPCHADLGCGMQVAGLQAGDSTVRLFEGALIALRELHTNPAFENVMLASASSSLVPAWSWACMAGLEIFPGVPVEKAFSYQQIGREGKLSPDKRTHFRELLQDSGIPYEEMLFFDDCGYGDHVGDLYRQIGVIGQRTPNGMTEAEWREGLARFAAERGESPGQ